MDWIVATLQVTKNLVTKTFMGKYYEKDCNVYCVVKLQHVVVYFYFYIKLMILYNNF